MTAFKNGLGVAKHVRGRNLYWEAYIYVGAKRHTLYFGKDFFEACCARKSCEAAWKADKVA